jgi:hypothetical protein
LYASTRMLDRLLKTGDYAQNHSVMSVIDSMTMSAPSPG